MPSSLFLIAIIYIILLSDPEKQYQIDLGSPFSMMKDGTNIIQSSNISSATEDGIILITHPQLLKFLGTVDRICVDATFSVTPKLFSQVWIIYGKITYICIFM